MSAYEVKIVSGPRLPVVQHFPFFTISPVRANVPVPGAL